MTGYVSTRYYRAPEIMLTWQKYDVEVDIWSAGCIFAEMLEGKPLFPGKDHVNQFSIITELLGTPPDDVIQTICSENVRQALFVSGALADEHVADSEIRPIIAQARTTTACQQVQERRPARYVLRMTRPACSLLTYFCSHRFARKHARLRPEEACKSRRRACAPVLGAVPRPHRRAGGRGEVRLVIQ